METWESTKRRLDRRWKRVAFIFWLPLAAGAIYFLASASYHSYVVYFENFYTFACHRDYAGFKDNTSLTPPYSTPENDKALMIAHRRIANRFSSEVRDIENSIDFRMCIYRDYLVGTYWRNHSWVWSEAGSFIFWTLLLGTFIFTTFLRKVGNGLRNIWLGLKNWVLMKS